MESIRQGLVFLWKATLRMRRSNIKQIKNLINSHFNSWCRHMFWGLQKSEWCWWQSLALHGDQEKSDSVWVLGLRLCVGVHGGTGIWATWSLSGNGPQRWVLFWSCCDPVDQPRSTYLRVDKSEVGQREWGNGKRGGPVSKETALFLPIRRLPILLIPRSKFLVMSCFGRLVGTPPRSDEIRESLAWGTAARTCQWKPSGGGVRVSQ